MTRKRRKPDPGALCTMRRLGLLMLSPAAVAKRRGVSSTAVKAAIARGDLLATRLIGPDGTVSGYGVTIEDADAWVPRAVGRPRAQGTHVVEVRP